MRRLLGLCGLLVVASPVRAQDSAPLSSPDLVGEVRCVAGVPEPGYVRDPSSAPHGIPRAETIRHETAHVVQLLGRCDSLLALWARDPQVKLAAEVEATCVGLTVYPDSAERRQARDARRFALGMAYVRWISFGEIYAAFERWCR